MCINNLGGFNDALCTHHHVQYMNVHMHALLLLNTLKANLYMYILLIMDAYMCTWLAVYIKQCLCQSELFIVKV